ncbi:MAG: UDP-N-acetylmuramate--L-alanine ligase [Muribaculaceae bacterium]|nr:UDP-N-acetylmuramate--L-alanine ligase [Muribaculaceae bacterium]
MKQNIYFIGAGGIGMAALERYFLAEGYCVGGYERTPSDLTTALQNEGVTLTFDQSIEAIPANFHDPDTTLIVYTPAVPADMPQLAWFRDNGFEVVKRAAVLGVVTRRSKSLCFAGTHGKTTTSSMAAHILYTSECGCNAFLGGILRNYNSNFLLSESSEYSVVEADEFDRSFHQLSPYIAVITSTDPDHLDIYGNEEAYLESFRHFTELIADNGYLVIHEGLKMRPNPAPGVKVYTYSRDRGDFHAENIRRGNGTIIYDLHISPECVSAYGELPAVIENIELGVPVEVNIENSIASIAACLLTGQVSPETVRSSMASFMGPKRRFEFALKETMPGGKVIIDDYAHHPDELKASISSVKALYPDMKLTVAFQPHLFTRTRDFAPDFAAALSLADRVVLIPIYPARELPIQGVTSEIILKDVSIADKRLVEKDRLVDTLLQSDFEVLLIAGAGDINLLIPELVAKVAK